MKKKLSRQARIKILLVLDSVFFLVEIIIGYWLKSLSLVADSFHMLNDVMSLIVALYAIKLASRTKFSPKYSYGWQRAEVLGALVNGIFLLALCLTVLIEAIQRFFEYEEIRNPILILIVGGVGLFSNIIGILLFHEHNHSHNSSTPTEVGEDTIQPLDEIHVHPAATRHS
ncbi:16283_t:CDS:2, partial [Acaulospora morrowiae]